ncbi:MAG: nucleotidyltransferase domain-containing protein [Nitrospirae bacterium]|nr:nucleotidyltransferase domain-containing protein [Nitrospirota bacterium]
MDKQDINVINQFKELVSQKINIIEIKAFGSRARGDNTLESDLDVFMVVESLNHELEKYISDCAWEAGFPQDIIVMPTTITQSDLLNSPIRQSLFIKNIYKEGINF